MSKEIAKGFEEGDKFSVTNGEEKKTYTVVSSNWEVENPPEYVLKNVETEEIHEPVQWPWLDREDLEIVHD